MGGHEAVTRDGAWVALAERMGFDSKAIGLQDAYCTYLADFEVNAVFTLLSYGRFCPPTLNCCGRLASVFSIR